MKKTFQIFLLLLISAVKLSAQNPAKHIPEFTFYKLDNTVFRSSDIQSGKPIFFVFFDSGCEHCQHAMHEIDLHFNKFKNSSVYLVTLDGVQTINNFMVLYAPRLSRRRNVIILRDLKNEFISKFNPRKYPSMLLYSPKGSLIAYEDDDKNISGIYNHL
jgi:peroxiredoxin